MSAAAPLLVYSLPVSSYGAKLRIALEAKGVDYVERAPPGGYRSDEYRAIVPMGTIPALIVEGVVLSESEVIAEYLEDRYPQPTLLPGDALQRARIRFVSRFHDLYVEPPVRGLFAQVNPARRDAGVVDARRLEIERLVQRLDTFVDPQPFALSPTLSLADCGFAVTLPLARMMLEAIGRPLTLPSRISGWLQAVHEHPAAQRALAPWRPATEAWIAQQLADGSPR